MKILVIEHNQGTGSKVRDLLDGADEIEVETASIADAAQGTIRGAPDVLIVDARFSRDRAVPEILRASRSVGIEAPAIIVSSDGRAEAILDAMRAGARDYLDASDLTARVLRDAVERSRPRPLPDNASSISTGDAAEVARRLVGTTPAMLRVRHVIARCASSDSTVLIRGETGTGKEVVARTIHQTSHRRAAPFVAVNCSALPSSLAESLLFGHERGAFTGADRRFSGHLEQAGNGTLLLDEIGDMPLALQAKLLRVLEERRFQPLGAETPRALTARVLAATHTDLDALVNAGRFRADLFYRLNVVAINLPSLAERREDIPALLSSFSKATERRIRLTDGAVEWLARRPWPGNVRQLKNAIAMIAALADDDVVDVDFLDSCFEANFPSRDLRVSLEGSIDQLLELVRDHKGSKLVELERRILLRAMERSEGNKAGAARLLGIPRTTLERKLTRRGVEAA